MLFDMSWYISFTGEILKVVIGMNFIKLILLAAICFILLFNKTLADTTEVKYVGEFKSNLTAPTSLVVSADEIAVLEPYLNQLKIFSPSGIITKQVSIEGDANGLSRLNSSTYLFCDFKKHEITAVNNDNSKQYNYFENKRTFSDPTDLITLNSKIYVLDAGTKTINIFNYNGDFLNQFIIDDNNLNKIGYSSSFTIINGNYYIFDQSKSKVWVLDSNGNYISSFGSFGADENQVTRGGDIISGKNNILLIADRYQSRVVMYDLNGNHIGTFPSNKLEVNLNIPTGLAIDENGTLYVASTESSKIQIFQISIITSQRQPLDADPIFPESNDTLIAKNVRLIATTKSPVDRIINGFDFQLFVSDTNSNPIAEGLSVSAVGIFDSLQSEYLYRTEWQPENIIKGQVYWWRSRVIADNISGNWSKMKTFTTTNLPDRIELYQNYPNPFNPETHISFNLPEALDVKIEIFNLTGQRIKIILDNFVEAGPQEVVWDGRNNSGNPVASGVYFYRLSAKNFSQTKKMVLIK